MRLVPAAAVVVLLTTVGAPVATAAQQPGPSAPRTRFDLVRGCFALSPADSRRYVVRTPAGYRADPSADLADAEPFFAQATGLGNYLLFDADGGMLAASQGAQTARVTNPGPAVIFSPQDVRGDGLVLRARGNERLLDVDADGRLVTRATGAPRLALVRTSGCRTFPEAELGATGTPFRGRRKDGTVFGWADPHLHLTADIRAGGRVIRGPAFSPYGIPTALGGDADDHGPDGRLDVTGNLLRGDPAGTHGPGGWPTFDSWPVFDTATHTQLYYRWLQRAWLSGLRLTVSQLIEDEPLCEIEPIKNHSCDEGDTIELEAERIRALEEYVDAQAGGPGRGFLRVVVTSAEARRAIERGKLAVLLGVESSNPFGCSQVRGRPDCDRAEIDRGIDRFSRLGVRAVFLTHWVDNALGGAALEGGDKGLFIGALQVQQTTEPFRTGPCPLPGQGEEVAPATPEMLEPFLFGPAAEAAYGSGLPVYPPGKQCNAKGLTDLGRYAVERLFDRGILIEADHLSERGRAELLTRAEAAGAPLVSSHTDTGGPWTDEELGRLYAIGGYAVATRTTAPKLPAAVLRFERFRKKGRLHGVGMGTDTGGFATLPEPVAASVAPPLRYPFTSLDGKVRFERQQTGQRTFDFNRDGVAHYGLFVDLLAQMRGLPDGRRATAVMFRGAEAYLRTWARAERAAVRRARPGR